MKVRFNKVFKISELDNKRKSSLFFWKLPKLTTRLKTRNILVVSIALLVGACSTPTGLTYQKASRLTAHNVPNKWQENIAATENNTIATDWVKSFKDNGLAELIGYALQSSYALDADRIGVSLAKERLNISAATDFPELSLSLANSRNKQVSNSVTTYQNSADLSLDLSYEIDLWGKLSDQQNQDRLNYAAAQASYQHSKLTLVADISKAWFNLTQAQQLLNLYQERAENLQRNLLMIQSSYQLGLNDALDVYLTKNTVNQELARVAQQQQALKVSSRALELLVGDYPLAKKVSEQNLPFIADEIKLGLPAQLLTRRADIQASWLSLLALDAGLAIAHKQRFPSFNLNASVGDNASELTNLLNGGALAWSLMGNITSPLFNAGRLESLETQAKLTVVQNEKLYLQQVYQAFADVENSVSERESLNQQYNFYLKAQENALAAEKLSFDQYLRGLVTYTTVLESQRRSFDAQTTVIQLTNELLQNRIEIYLALGGDYLDGTTQTQQTNSTKGNSLPASLTHRISMEK
ncbi:efflux transporter outer membrane subunit [Cognaticolwellia beringensis]|uniref:efflux transporter outer membrane subunit n=1 Tax=Cognaticolwellia beringensis TaxID=1967665 RepID=UPI0012F75F48|nr:efflux transporter outer membrane subunit [Cognaticolwellia beringensis]